MLPTSSRTFFGRQERSIGDCSNHACESSRGSAPAQTRRGPAKPTATGLQRPTSNRAQIALFRHREPPLGGDARVVCSARCERAENEDCGSSPGSRPAWRWPRAAGEPTRTRRSRRASSPGGGRHLPHVPAPRAAHAHGDRRAQHGAEGDPRHRGHDHRPALRHDRPGVRRYMSQPGLASHSRPVWIVDRPPGPVHLQLPARRTGRRRDRVLQHVGARTAGARTDRDVRLGCTAVEPGTHVVRYEVAAGLNGKAKARLEQRRDPERHVRRQDHAAAPAVLRQQQRPDRRRQVVLAGRPPQLPGWAAALRAARRLPQVDPAIDRVPVDLLELAGVELESVERRHVLLELLDAARAEQR